MAQKKLAGMVAVDGVWYGPDSDLPEAVAAKITNPKAWATAVAEVPVVAAPKAKGGTRSGARLARSVSVAGKWYGPNDVITDEVAARITNPKAWEGGQLPELCTAEETVAPPPTPAADPEPATDVEAPAAEAPAEVESEPEPKPKTRRGASASRKI